VSARPPDFRDLVGDDLPAEERERLQRVHEMLIAAGPPPELPPQLEQVPTDRPAAEPIALPRRRTGAALALAAAIALVAFLGGYIAGHSKNTPFESVQSVKLGNRQVSAVVKLGPKDTNGNTPMQLKVEGLPPLPAQDYYVLFMTKRGKPIVECGTFHVRTRGSVTVPFTVAYDPSDFDGFQLARWRHEDRKDVPLFSAQT
jgi:hypothetical protein